MSAKLLLITFHYELFYTAFHQIGSDHVKGNASSYFSYLKMITYRTRFEVSIHKLLLTNMRMVIFTKNSLNFRHETGLLAICIAYRKRERERAGEWVKGSKASD